MHRSMFVIIAIISFIVIIISCSKPGADPAPVNCTGVPKAFAADVNPIIQTFCNQGGCHDAGSSNGPGPLLNYTQVFNARVNIRAQVLSGLMPQNSALTSSQKNIIACWIDSGAPNN